MRNGYYLENTSRHDGQWKRWEGDEPLTARQGTTGVDDGLPGCVEGKPDVVMTKGDYRGARGGQHMWRYILRIGLAAGEAFVASRDDEVCGEPQKNFGCLRCLSDALLGGAA